MWLASEALSLAKLRAHAYVFGLRLGVPLFCFPISDILLFLLLLLFVFRGLQLHLNTTRQQEFLFLDKSINYSSSLYGKVSNNNNSREEHFDSWFEMVQVYPGGNFMTAGAYD